MGYEAHESNQYRLRVSFENGYGASVASVMSKGEPVSYGAEKGLFEVALTIDGALVCLDDDLQIEEQARTAGAVEKWESLDFNEVRRVLDTIEGLPPTPRKRREFYQRPAAADRRIHAHGEGGVR